MCRFDALAPREALTLFVPRLRRLAKGRFGRICQADSGKRRKRHYRNVSGNHWARLHLEGGIACFDGADFACLATEWVRHSNWLGQCSIGARLDLIRLD